MGRRYYCDYCDKSFADNPVNRKLHLSGSIHIRNKKAHYEAVKDEREILQDDVQKKPCRSFMTTGECRFGDRCQYSHLTNEDKARLSRKVLQKQKKAEKLEEKRKKTLSNLDSVLDKWVEDRSSRKRIEDAEKESDENRKNEIEEQSHNIPEYQLADCLKNVPSIPPSLLPPSKEAILNAEYSDWG